MGVVQKLHSHLRHYGLRHTLAAASRAGLDLAARRRARSWNDCMAVVDGAAGIEIGGPSRIFSPRGLLPVYAHASRVDGCNFAAVTVWEGALHDGAAYGYGNHPNLGRQYIREATDLSGVAAGTYDFVCSSHMLEHAANPLQALHEWFRILKDAGTLILVLPHKDATFDHRRPVTVLDHLVADHANDVGEDDLTHLDEILELHDMSRDPGAGDRDHFSRRSRDNRTNRCLHHHVFDTNLVAEMVARVGLQVVALEPRPPHHIITVCRKVPTGGAAQDPALVAAARRWSDPLKVVQIC